MNFKGNEHKRLFEFKSALISVKQADLFVHLCIFKPLKSLNNRYNEKNTNGGSG